MATREFSYRPNGSPQFLQDHLQKFGTVATTEEQVGPSIKIPSAMLGKNGTVVVSLRASSTNDAVVKTLRVRAGNTPDVLTGTVVGGAPLTSTAGNKLTVTLSNRDNTSAQYGTQEVSGSVAQHSTYAIDTAKDVYLVFSTQKASGAAASIALESYLVELFAEPLAQQFQ